MSNPESLEPNFELPDMDGSVGSDDGAGSDAEAVGAKVGKKRKASSASDKEAKKLKFKKIKERRMAKLKAVSEASVVGVGASGLATYFHSALVMAGKARAKAQLKAGKKSKKDAKEKQEPGAAPAATTGTTKSAGKGAPAASPAGTSEVPVVPDGCIVDVTALLEGNSGGGGELASSSWHGDDAWVPLLHAAVPACRRWRDYGRNKSSRGRGRGGGRGGGHAGKIVKVPPGAPDAVIVTISARRAVGILKALAPLKAKVAKCFAKHMSLEDQCSFLNRAAIPAAVGTPARLSELSRVGALDWSRTKLVIFDCKPDGKGFNALSNFEIGSAISDLWSAVLFPLARDSGLKLAFV
jgi:hypothetical protein